MAICGVLGYAPPPGQGHKEGHPTAATCRLGQGMALGLPENTPIEGGLGTTSI